MVAKLNAEINAVMKEPDSLERLAKAGFDPVVKNVAEANAYFKSEVESWGKMVKRRSASRTEQRLPSRLQAGDPAALDAVTRHRISSAATLDARHKAGHDDLRSSP